MRRVIVALTVALAIFGNLLVLTAQTQQPKKPPQKAETKKPSVPVKNEGWRITYGDPKAKVKIEAFYPIGSGGHEFVLEFSRKLAESFPSKVQVIVYDWTKPKAADEFSKRGLNCGIFIINGKMEVTHKGKTVAFTKRPEMMGWNFDLLKGAVAEEVKRVYGKGGKPEQKKTAPVQKTGAVLESSPKGVIEIFVPCGLAGPYGELARMFQKKNPDIRFRPNVTGIVALLNQLEAGATPDIFLAIGTFELTKLAEKGKFVEGSLVKCARVPLSVVVPKRNPAGVKRLEDLASPKVKQIITYPFKLSGGRGAKQALEAAKLWDAVSQKIFTPKVPDQAKQLLKKGQAEAGILYRTCLMESYIPDKPPVIEHDLVAVQTIPQSLYEPIYAAAVLVKGGKNLDAAREFLKFLQTQQARQVWTKWGFEPVEETVKPAKLSAKSPLFIYAGAAFRPPLEAMGREFEREYGVPVKFNFTGSNCLLAQIILSQQGDLFLPGEEFYVRQAQKRGYVLKSEIIGYFVPVILVRKGNPKGIKSLKDLAKSGIKVGLGDPKACAIGEISEAILRKNGLTEAVHKNVALRAMTAPELANALRLGGIDACINWDAIANYPWVRPAVEVITIPPEQNVITANPLAILRTTRNRQAAELFLQFALSEGQRILRQHGFTAKNDLPAEYSKALFTPVASATAK
ncbi:MAG: molybdate ABC transporter substrate-binding protein [Armatimonadetes bacterium]|nr:molybdate ABC transporter substrate-binding protein [Armatimonadota bacterium]MCX7968513.1 molybdate ABC transporter substrate-binding protein [Armatimonadota bacterium]MDW8144209.1 molybdate ABC transporter substrate-binding protein [Armatimonadota bacterium]